jgi:hypothetical protein
MSVLIQVWQFFVHDAIYGRFRPFGNWVLYASVGSKLFSLAALVLRLASSKGEGLVFFERRL